MRSPKQADERTDSQRVISRRTMLKATGAVGAAALVPFAGTAAAESTHTQTVDDALETTGGLQEVLVVFETNADVDRLRHLDFQHDHEEGYHKFAVLPIGYTVLTGEQIAAVADWPEVRYVEANTEIEYYNDDAREVTGAKAVQEEQFYTGESVHAVVIDSGIDGNHPDHQANLRHNYRFVKPLDRESMWVDVGPADTGGLGHGTHVSGSVAGDGTASNGKYQGMAPDADLTVYSTTAGAALLNIVAAYDHLLERQRAGKTNVQVVNNSYGSTVGNNYNLNGAINVATYHAFEEGILPVFAGGNAGPDTNTYSDLAKGPHVLGAAATDDETKVTGFSSRGRPPDFDGLVNYDRETAFENLQAFYSTSFAEQPVVTEKTYTGTVGPGANASGVSVGQSAYEQWTAPEDAGYVELVVSWTPPGPAEDLDIYLHEGAKDGPVVASGASLENPETLSGDVDPGTTYFVEIRPYTNVTASYTVNLTARKALSENERPSGPYGIYRPSVGAPGQLVMSTLAPDDAFQTYPTIIGKEKKQGTEPYYGKLSGTSMASPVTAGLAALVIDAYRQTQGEYPDPIDIITTVEATAKDARADHNVYNIGTGFVDVEAAVKRAETGDLADFSEVTTADYAREDEAPEFVFTPKGARADDGSVFTAGQTDQVDIMLMDTDTEAVVRDTIPFGWDVVAGDPHTVYTEDGTRYVEFDTTASTGDTLTYFIEAPDSTGVYEFGPAQARTADGETVFFDITGTETNTVGGVDTNID